MGLLAHRPEGAGGAGSDGAAAGSSPIEGGSLGALGDRLLNRTFLQLMVVNVLIGLIQPLNGLVDSMLTGSFLGVEAMSSYALFLPVSSFAVAIGCFFAVGTQVCCTVAIGRGHVSQAKAITGTAYAAVLAVGVLFAVLLLAFPTQIALALGASYAISGQVQATASFLQGYAIGLPAVLLVQVMAPLMQIEGRKSLAVASTACVLAVNVAGDALNLFLLHGGLFGMALATSASYFAGLAIGLVYFLRFSRMFRFSLAKRSMDSLKEIAKNGAPSLAYYGSIAVRTAFFNWLIVTSLDNQVMAVMLVINSCTNLVDAVIGGVGDATLLLGGVLYGERDRNGQRNLLKLALLSGGLILLAITVAAIVAAVPIVSLYADDASAGLVEAAARALSLVSLCFVPDVLACVLKKYIQSVERKLYTTVTNVLCNVVYVCGISFVLVHFAGSDGLFLSYVASYVAILATHLVYAQVISPKETFLTFDSLLYMPQDDIPRENRAEYAITALRECARVSEQVQGFCLARGASARSAYLLALVTEEVTANSVQHGFRDGRGNVVVVKALVAKGKIVLNIKDNCVLFDVMSYYEKLQETEGGTTGAGAASGAAAGGMGAAGVGIRIIVGSASSISYRNSFNLNNLRIEISA